MGYVCIIYHVLILALFWNALLGQIKYVCMKQRECFMARQNYWHCAFQQDNQQAIGDDEI